MTSSSRRLRSERAFLSGIEVARTYNMRAALALLFAGIVAASVAAAAGGGVERLEGTVTELHPQHFVLLTAENKSVVVDISALGGITAALGTGQNIVAIGTMDPGGETLHAVGLESPPIRHEPARKP
jgi:hypothetical protein